MPVFTDYIQVITSGNAEVIDVTQDVEKSVQKSKIKNGIACINVMGSTGAITTCEYEPGLVEDIRELFDRLIPEGPYKHDKMWGDGNGHSHLRSSLIGPSLTIPIVKGDLALGTWQQIIFIDFDNRHRERKLIIQMLGDL